jgi:hypothetical protein
MFEDSDDCILLVDDLLGDVEGRLRVERDAVGVVAAEKHHLTSESFIKCQNLINIMSSGTHNLINLINNLASKRLTKCQKLDYSD